MSLMGRLTTHVLDMVNGIPAAGIELRLYSLDGGRDLKAAAVTNSDGRCEQPLLADEHFASGEYELEFDVGDYFRARDERLADPAFLNTVVIRFTILGDEHYHVPLLVSPWSYSTYRGS